MVEAEAPIARLREEHERARELLVFLGRLGERVRAGEPVSPQTVRVGVGLLDAYLHRVHARQFDLDLRPEVTRLGRAECEGQLEVVRENHEAMRRAAHDVLEAAARWARGEEAARPQVAARLVRLAVSDSAFNHYEEAHPFPCLAHGLAPGARTRVGTRLRGHGSTKRALEANMARFLAHGGAWAAASGRVPRW